MAEATSTTREPAREAARAEGGARMLRGGAPGGAMRPERSLDLRGGARAPRGGAREGARRPDAARTRDGARGGGARGDGARGSGAFEALLRAIAEAPSVRPLDLALEGRKLGRYAVERRLGQGGMGVVYEALDTMLGRKVALKVLRASDRGSAATRERLLGEARRLAALAHPNIAAVYDAGEHDGIVFLALERAVGRSLRARLDEPAPLPLPRVVAILQAIASALACAHEAGIVHRDLKPENVVVGDGGAVKIVDFGIATLSGRGAAPAGTRRYMAPEQAAGGPASACADVYAFGVLARELLSAPAAGARGRATRAALGRLAAACSAEDPEARPRDGAALLAALDAIVAPAPAASRAGLLAAGAAAAGLLAAVLRLVPSPPAEPPGAPVTVAGRAGATAAWTAGGPRWQDGRFTAPWAGDARDGALAGDADGPPDDETDTGGERGASVARDAPHDPRAAGRDVTGRAGARRRDREAPFRLLAAGDLAAPDVAGPASARAGRRWLPAPGRVDLPVSAYLASDRLYADIHLGGLGPIATAGAGRAPEGAPAAQLVPDGASATVLADGKGGTVIQLTFRLRPGAPGGEAGPGDGGSGSGGGDAPGSGGTVLGGVVPPGGAPARGAGAAGGAGAASGPGVPITNTILPQDAGMPAAGLPAYGSGAGGVSGPVRHFLCADFTLEDVRVAPAEGGTLQIVSVGTGEGGEPSVLAIIDVTGAILWTDEPISVCDFHVPVALDG